MKFATLLEAIAHWAEQTPDKVCLIDANCDRKNTYADFWRHIRIFARRLCAMGLQKGDRVVVRVGPLIETFTAQFGIYLAGGVYCPVEKHLKELKILEMLDYFDATLLVSSERVAYSGHWIDLTSVYGDGEPLDDYVFPNPENMCAIIFTTGTTGKAKGVMLRFRTSQHTAETQKNAFGITARDVFFWLSPLDRAGGIRVFGHVFLSGATAVHADGFIFMKELFEYLHTYRVSFAYFPSSVIAILLNTAAYEFEKLRSQIQVMFFGAGALPEVHKRRLQALLPETKLYLNYGSTEITSISFLEFSNLSNTPNCVGKPYPETDLCLLDDNGNVTHSATGDNPGIITCRNDSAMAGYWKDPTLTEQVLQDQWVVMTDMGYMDDGFLYLMGRRDDVIISGGHKIAPYEIENLAAQIPGVLECACIPQTNSILGSVPVLFVTMRQGSEFSEKAIAQYLSSRIATSKMPRAIRLIDAMPQTTNMKIDRKVLKHVLQNK